MSSIDLSPSVLERMPIEAAAISFQICKITILMFCDTIDNMHSPCPCVVCMTKTRERKKILVKHCPYVWKQQSPCIYVRWPLGQQLQHQSHRECLPSVSSSSYRDTTLIWAAHEATRQWINHHCGCTESKWKTENENNNNNNKNNRERSRWNSKMKLTTTRKHDDKSNPTKLFMFYNK